ncbi:MAG: hypothetical protein ACKOCQ_05675 [Candidatus Nitrosotenuis sp.]
MKKILVTGSGGIGGVNFVRALRATKEEFYIVGTDFNRYYIQFPQVDVRVRSPRHSDPKFIELVSDLISKYKIDFLHPQPSSEAQVVTQNIEKIQTRTLLPSQNVIIRDKLETQKILSQKNIPVAKTRTIQSSNEIDDAFDSFKIKPVWVRAKKGAGGNLSLLCNSAEEINYWVNLWVKKNKVGFSDFMIQQNLPGRNLAWDSFWYEGKFIASFTRERLEYPFKHISPSGITGTPTVSKIIVDEAVNKLGQNSVMAIDSKPHGNYSVDLKGDENNNFHITEIDAGKFHTTTPLWGYIASKTLKMEPEKNLPYLYVMLGTQAIEPKTIGFDIYSEGLHLLRHLDCGVWLWKEDGYKEQIL